MLPGQSERYVPVVESAMDEDLDPHPCEEDRANAEEMEQAIRKFLDGIPAVKSKRYEQLHRHLACQGCEGSGEAPSPQAASC